MMVSSAFAYNVNDYAYTATQRVKILGENLVTNGTFETKDGWTNAAGEEISADVWDIALNAGSGPNGENVITCLSGSTADAALCRSWELPSGQYIVMYDIKGESNGVTGIVNGNSSCADFFLTSSGTMTKADGDVQVAGVDGFKDVWKTNAFTFFIEDGQKLVMHFEKLAANTMVTNVQIYPAQIVYDDRILQSKLDYVDKLIATGKFVEDTDNGFIENVVGYMRSIMGTEEMDDPSNVAAVMEAYEEELLAWLNKNAADMLKDEKRWSEYTDTRKMDGIGGNWKGTGGRWFHINNGGSNEITNDGDEIGHRFQGGVEGNASQYYTITPANAGTYMFSLDVVGHYMAGGKSNQTYVSGTGDNYVTDWNRDFTGVTVYAGKDIMGSDPEANAAMNIEQEGQKVECGPINNPNAKNNPQKFVVFYEVSQEMVDAKTPVTFGMTYIMDPDRNPTKMGSNVNIANPQIRLIGVTQELIDYQNEVAKIIVQQNPLKERLEWANADLQKTAADGYPWGKAALQEKVEWYQPVYEASLAVVDAEGNVLNEAFIKEQMEAAATGAGILYSDSLLHSVQAMNSARSAYNNINKLTAVTYPQKVADAEAVYADDFYGAGNKEAFRAVIDATIAKRVEVLAATNDETREADEATLNDQLAVLAEAVEAFKVSGEPVPFVNIDFSNPFETTAEEESIVKGAAGQMVFAGAVDAENNDSGVNYTLGFGEEKMDVLRVGSGDAVVNFAEADQAGDNEVLRVTFDLFVGNLSGQYVGVQLQNADGQRIAGFRLNRYNGTVDYNDFNNADYTGLDLLTYVTGVGSSSASNVAIAADNNRSSFTLIVDNKAKAVKGIVANPQKGTCTGVMIPMRTDLGDEAKTPIEDTKIAKFVLNSNYNNKDRRCWFDNLKVFKYASAADGPIVDGIATVENAENAAAGIYSLSGLRLQSAPQKGLYIMNGKKYVVK